MQRCKWIVTCLLIAHCESFSADRINHEGRVLGPEPIVSAPILFNTPEADAIVSAMEIMPRDSAWNEDISRRPLLTNSDAMIAQIIADLRSDRRTLRAFHEMNFVLVPDDQPLVPIDFFYYADESDPSPYPIPANLPVETWPRETGALTLSDWQRDIDEVGGDRHSVVVMPGSGFLWETWLTRYTSSGWEASNGAKFELKSNTLRPFGWTSGDAAGLPLFPALVRYDECLRGMVEHAMRIVVKRSRLGPIYPATHHASVGNLTDPNIPAMGQRVRLKSSFVIPENWTIYEKAVLRGLKRYGALVADNGNFFSISVTPDDRYPSGAFSHLSSISITNFEVVASTGANEGPRSPGAAIVTAGADLSAGVNAPILLKGSVMVPNGTGPITTSWSLYSGPGSVHFADTSQTNTTATFATAGEYVLMLKAADDIHTPSFDAVRVTVGERLITNILQDGESLRVEWAATEGSYTVEAADEIDGQWREAATLTTTNYVISEQIGRKFFRVRRN